MLPMPAAEPRPTSPVVAIVGASSGIGRAAAARFLGRGATVALMARRGGLLEEIVAERRPSGERAWAHAGDITVRSDVEAFIDGIYARYARLDALIVNAGLNIRNRALAHLTPADWRRMIAANLDGAFHCTHAALPRLRAQGGGLLIYVASVSARYADASGAAYQAAKHGLVGLANAVRQEEQRNGIRATVIYPGMVNTPLILQRPVPPTPEQLAAILQPDDVAAAIEFVAGLPAHVVVPDLEIRAVSQV
jgi:NADP-dependent 3-hydroxy acid dehydrogenase YdfG